MFWVSGGCSAGCQHCGFVEGFTTCYHTILFFNHGVLESLIVLLESEFQARWQNKVVLHCIGDLDVGNVFQRLTKHFRPFLIRGPQKLTWKIDRRRPVSV